MSITEEEVSLSAYIVTDEITWQQQESARIYAETEIERTWWPTETKFFTRDHADEAQRNGTLIEVPHKSNNHRLIGRLTTNSQDGEPNLLRPEAHAFLEHALSLWREELNGAHEDVQLAITSLQRHALLQAKLLNGERKYNAVQPEESSHLAGASFDISVRSYYVTQPDNSVKKVQKWDQSTGPFNHQPFKHLHAVFGRLASEGLCNVVIENVRDQKSGIVEPTVMHVCVKPGITLPSRQSR